ncbi:uncharacterized protein TNCT_451091 [Trichonephila clavata]|uniref:Uncharacterized protein n=1 Tax=Trichonephila clavata TaxID=2740835 RepID=A0A8X6KWZ1_TRICU|nr:uncharacterized protein TNCT_451091 [Trichonephila clavata]
MKQDLEKTETVYFSNFLSKKKLSKVPRNVNTVPGGTTATPANPSGKTEYRKRKTKPEEPDEGATYKEKCDFQLRKDRCYTVIYTNISSDLKNLITETTDGVVAWKILKDHFEPVTQLLDNSSEQNTNQGKMSESSYLV